MDTANLVASWVSAIVTTVGLGSVMAQVAAIKDQLDPFNEARGEDHLAAWGTRDRQSTIWYSLAKPPPLGPVLEADINVCLGVQTLYLSRRPKYKFGSASWTALLAVFHPQDHPQYLAPSRITPTNTEAFSLEAMHKNIRLPFHSTNWSTSESPSLPWHQRLPTQSLIFHDSTACTTMSRNTFILFVLLSQCRHMYCFDGPAGLRLGFGGYNGTYRLEWPLGSRPSLRFEPHTNYQRGKDAFPIYFARRPRKCLQMALGVIERRSDIAGHSVKVAFAGRKKPGSSFLKLLPKRFGAQRSAADLWNMFGGEAHEVDFFLRERLEDARDADLPRHNRALRVPSLVDDEFSTVYMRKSEMEAIADCLDCLPWSPVAWSIHRGMKDILVAYALPYMKAYRNSLASTLHSAVTTYALRLIQLGWEPDFVRGDMADQAASAFCGDDKCSGDVCRIVSAAAEVFCSKTVSELDHTMFWMQNLQIPSEKVETGMLSSDMVAALIKVHFVWWSHEFDYDIYSRLPLNITVC